MADRFFPDKRIENAPVARPVSRRVLTWLGVVVVAGGLLACGFIVSARQHFEAISLGYQSEELRRQSAQLEEKLRQLELEYARAASPVVRRSTVMAPARGRHARSPRIRRSRRTSNTTCLRSCASSTS